MRSPKPPKRQPVYIAIQGGAALGAFPWGALDALLENPSIQIIGATGTSSGALTAAFLIEGLILGGEKLAQKRLADCWHGLSRYQSDSQPFWYDTTCDVTDAWLRVCDMMMPRSFSAMTRSLIQEAGNMIVDNHHGPVLNYSPILGFLQAMKHEGKGLDFRTLQKCETHTLIVNATHIAKGGNPWNAQPNNERLFTGATLTPEALAASGSLIELTPPVLVGNDRLYDGAYFSNPHLPAVLDLCEDQGTTLIVLRTRPGHAFKNFRSDRVRTADERRAFFNAITDRDLGQSALTHPGVPIYVIEPCELEEPNRHLLKPELRFQAGDIRKRHHDGYRTALSLKIENSQPGFSGARAGHGNASVRRDTALLTDGLVPA